MIYGENSSLIVVSLHLVGNKSAEDGIILSKTNLDIKDELKSLLVSY